MLEKPFSKWKAMEKALDTNLRLMPPHTCKHTYTRASIPHTHKKFCYNAWRYVFAQPRGYTGSRSPDWLRRREEGALKGSRIQKVVLGLVAGVGGDKHVCKGTLCRHTIRAVSDREERCFSWVPEAV